MLTPPVNRESNHFLAFTVYDFGWLYLGLSWQQGRYTHLREDQYVKHLPDVWKNDYRSLLDRKLHLWTAQSATGPSLRQQPDISTEQSSNSLPPLGQLEWACPSVEANRGMSELNPLYVNTTSLIPTGDEFKATRPRLTLTVTFGLPPTSFSPPPSLPRLLSSIPHAPLSWFPSRGAEQTDSRPNWDMCSWVTFP